MAVKNKSKPVEFDGFTPMPKRFMAWDKHQKDWVTKFLMPSTSDENSDDYTCPLTLGTNSKGEKDWLNNDQLIICQSTNLFDKDGEEIFEGTLVKNELGWKGIVKTFKGQWIVSYESGPRRCFHLLCDICKQLKVIGHILSTPELLKGE